MRPARAAEAGTKRWSPTGRTRLAAYIPVGGNEAEGDALALAAGPVDGLAALPGTRRRIAREPRLATLLVLTGGATYRARRADAGYARDNLPVVPGLVAVLARQAGGGVDAGRAQRRLADAAR